MSDLVPHLDGFPFGAALKLHRYLCTRHWNGHALVGPDPGVRFNFRAGRFVKAYLPLLHWNDDYCYLQAQGYWILANWSLHSLTGDTCYRDLAIQCSEYALTSQREDGGWDYPNSEWKGRVANSEGTWVCIGLLKTYANTGAPTFLDSVLAWHRFLQEKVGFQRKGDDLAANYFAGIGSERVPNNSAFVLRLLAELASVTGDRFYLEPCAGLLNFLKSTQRLSGEFPYALRAGFSLRRRAHFQCYQYNAFEALDLMRYYELTGDSSCSQMILRVLKFLAGGIAQDGHAFYDCTNHHRTVTYHAAALGAAFARGGELGFGNYEELADRAFSYLAAKQRPDGSFGFSRNDYHLLDDDRSYPRSLAMILCHLLIKTGMAVRSTSQQNTPSTAR